MQANNSIFILVNFFECLNEERNINDNIISRYNNNSNDVDDDNVRYTLVLHSLPPSLFPPIS